MDVVRDGKETLDQVVELLISYYMAVAYSENVEMAVKRCAKRIRDKTHNLVVQGACKAILKATIRGINNFITSLNRQLENDEWIYTEEPTPMTYTAPTESHFNKYRENNPSLLGVTKIELGTLYKTAPK